jgi:hypothetical protein
MGKGQDLLRCGGNRNLRDSQNWATETRETKPQMLRNVNICSRSLTPELKNVSKCRPRITLGWDRAASRWSAPGPGSRTRREDRAPSHRPQMSSGRLFLDRVARQHCPSPLHRQPQNNTHSAEPRGKGDISTLRETRHFYFVDNSTLRS